MSEAKTASGCTGPSDCSASEIQVLYLTIKLWRDECRRMCHELADLAGLPREPEPGWRNSIAAIKAKMNVEHSGKESRRKDG